jgi:hypothetical protein
MTIQKGLFIASAVFFILAACGITGLPWLPLGLAVFALAHL